MPKWKVNNATISHLLIWLHDVFGLAAFDSCLDLDYRGLGAFTLGPE
jgi:hypothetical protein